MKVLTAAEMREVDRLSTECHGIPSLTLMENAGRSVADFLKQRFPNIARRGVVVLCGKGNNGGDGFVAARYLRKMGVRVSVYLFAEPRDVKGDAATNLKRWKQNSGKLAIVRNSSDLDSPKAAFFDAAIIVDALLGTGARGPVEGLLREIIERVNFRADSVVSVDVPSGLNADTGEVNGAAIVADYTITFTAPKPGFFYGEGSSHTGRLVVSEIGSPRDLVWDVGKGHLSWNEADDFSIFALPRKPDGQKGDYGHALIVAGSVGKTGAAVLSSWAALRAGAGLVTIATPEPALPIVASHTPEIMTVPLPATNIGSIALRSLDNDLFASILKGKRALAIGPGLGTHEETQQFVRAALVKRATLPVILDADGLNAFVGHTAELKLAGQNLVLTPHPGEMARLLGREIKDVQANRLDVAQRAAADWNAHVILKGHQTIIASPNGYASINSTGNPGMATAGTGDVLTGILAGLTVQYPKDDWSRVLAFGVYLHGLAGDIAYAESGEAPLMASDLIRALPRAYQQFYAECGRA